jgi:hypothetical protein
MLNAARERREDQTQPGRDQPPRIIAANLPNLLPIPELILSMVRALLLVVGLLALAVVIAAGHWPGQRPALPADEAAKPYDPLY